MEFIFRGKSVSYSIQERTRGNARLWFRWEGRVTPVTLPVKRKREVTKAMVTAALSGWMSRQEKAPAPAEVTGKPMKSMVEAYLRLEHAHNKRRTVKSAREILEKFGDALGWPEAAALTKDLFRGAWPRLNAGKSAKTQANLLSEMGHFGRWLEEEKVIPVDFTRGVKRPPRSQFGTHEEIYEEEWFQPIWDALEHWARPIWEDHWYTGLDNADLWELEPAAHIVETKGKDGKPSWKIWKIRAKEGVRIDQPISSKIRDRWIERRSKCSKGDFMYPNVKDFANADSWGGRFRKELHRAQRRLGLPLLDVKCTRHTFATRHLLRRLHGEKDAPTFEQMRKWLGQSEDSRMLERIYAKISALAHLMD